MCVTLGTDAALVPVPLHPKRKRQRGYDQTSILANEIARRTGQPVFRGLRKARDTRQQVGLSRAERSLNLLDAFELAPGVRVPDNVILIDDVATTGATLTECAIALRNGGAKSVAAVVIAHGL
jgi:ComF family protein